MKKYSNTFPTIKVGEVTIRDVTQRTIGIIGMKGSGKTTALRLIIKALDRVEVPVVAIDPTGSLKDKRFYRIQVDRKYDPSVLKTVVNAAWAERAPLVLDISDLPNNEAVEFAQTLFPIVYAHRDGVAVIDELPDLTPQFGLKADEVIRFNRKCRNNNIGFIFTTQRPAQVDKNVLALADMLLVMRIAWPADVDVYETHMKHLGISPEKRGEMLSEIARFGPGEVYVLDFWR